MHAKAHLPAFTVFYFLGTLPITILTPGEGKFFPRTNPDHKIVDEMFCREVFKMFKSEGKTPLCQGSCRLQRATITAGQESGLTFSFQVTSILIPVAWRPLC